MLDLPGLRPEMGTQEGLVCQNGVLPHDKGSGPNGTLMWTDDLHGADARAWLALASEILQVAPAALTFPASGSPGPARRVAKQRPVRPERAEPTGRGAPRRDV